MLRESSRTHEEAVDFAAVMDGQVESGVPHGAELVRFAEAVVAGSASDREAARHTLADAMGAEALVDAAGVVSNFERMVRVADATGISIGPMAEEDLVLVRELGIEGFNARVSASRQAPSAGGARSGLD